MVLMARVLQDTWVVYHLHGQTCRLTVWVNPLRPSIYTQILQTDRSVYISLKNELREFVKRSRHFYLGDHFINFHNLSVDNVWILLGEN